MFTFRYDEQTIWPDCKAAYCSNIWAADNTLDDRVTRIQLLETRNESHIFEHFFFSYNFFKIQICICIMKF